MTDFQKQLIFSHLRRINLYYRYSYKALHVRRYMAAKKQENIFLNWKSHANYISKKNMRSIGILSKLRYYVILDALMNQSMFCAAVSFHYLRYSDMW